MSIPFDSARADRLMGEANIDLLLATSKHNVQYLLGGYRFIFFVAMDAVGHSRYLPFLVYERGEPQHYHPRLGDERRRLHGRPRWRIELRIVVQLDDLH